MSIPCLVHYDLDGVVCAILLKYILKDVEYKPIGYNKIPDHADEFIFKHKKSVIADLNLDKQHYQNMLASKNNILYIDHHKSDPCFVSKDNVKVIINEKYCAAANIMKYFKDKVDFPESFKTLTYLANDYDLFKLKEKESSILNYIFWSRGFNQFFSMFQNGYNASIVKSFYKPYEHHQKIVSDYIKSSPQYEINDCYKTLMIFCNQYISDVTLVLPDYDIYLIISDSHKISVRTKEPHSLVKSFEIISGFDDIESAGCHEYAGGINLSKNLTSDDKIMSMYETILKTIVDTLIPF